MRRKNVLQSGYNCVLCYYTRSISYWFTIGTKWGQSSWLLFNDATRKRILWPHHFCVFYLSWQLGEIVQYLKEKPPRVSGWQAPLKNETIRHICIKQSIHGFGFAVTPEHLDCKAASWFPPIYFFSELSCKWWIGDPSCRCLKPRSFHDSVLLRIRAPERLLNDNTVARTL